LHLLHPVQNIKAMQEAGNHLLSVKCQCVHCMLFAAAKRWEPKKKVMKASDCQPRLRF
jgi:hypothetical protein